MSEIRIIHQQIQLNLEHTVTQSSVTDKFVENLKVGQQITAQLVHLDNKYWLMIESIKLPVSRDTVEQMELKDNQVIRMRVRSTAEPVELQIVKNKPANSTQTNSATLLDTNSKNPAITSGQQQLTTNQTGKPKPSTTEVPDKLPATEKVNVDKLILEARKFLSKDMLSPDKSAKTQTPASENTIKSADNTQKAETPATKRKSDFIGNLISQSRTVTTENSNKGKATATKYANAEKNQINTAKSAESSVNKHDQVGRIAEKPSSNLQNITAKLAPVSADQTTAKTLSVSGDQIAPKAATTSTQQVSSKGTPVSAEHVAAKTVSVSGDQVSARITTKSTEQVSTKATPVSPQQIVQKSVSVKSTDSSVSSVIVDGVSNTTKTAPSQKRMKLEIPVTMPDSHKFPLLSEKMDTAFQRLMPALNNNGKSINSLFMQLQRLNQWTTDLKQSGSTTSASQPEKLAADLKESLKDLFRYINHKDNLRTGKSVEKALRQSGTFLEKRVNAEQQAAKSGNIKNATELTLHKDLKANLNRVLATALYNLAKINSSNTAAGSTTSGTATTPTPSGSTTSTGTGVTSEPSQSSQARQLTGNTTATNLIQSIRNRLQSFRGSKTNPNVMPELERITKEVLKNVQSALFRSQLGQLTNLRPDSAPQQWLFELPVMNNKEVDTFLIQFAEHATSEDENDGKKDWSLILQFDISPLGKLRAMLTWHEEKVQVRFLAEQHNTADLISKELDYFQTVLTNQGLSFEQLSVEQAMLDDINIRFSRGQSDG